LISQSHRLRFQHDLLLTTVGKRHDTTNTTDFCPRQTCYGLVVYVAELLRTCYGEVANLIRTCYGETGEMEFWPLNSNSICAISCRLVVDWPNLKQIVCSLFTG